MKVIATKVHNLQPKQYHSFTLGGSVDLDTTTDETDIRDIAEREGITALTYLELAQKVAQFLANQQYAAMREEYNALPATHFATAKA